MRIIYCCHCWSFILSHALNALVRASEPAGRVACEKEQAVVIPDRASVEKERIETDVRTAAGVTDGKGRIIAGVVLMVKQPAKQRLESDKAFSTADLLPISLTW